jgi:RNA polymerase sigma-54 factor
MAPQLQQAVKLLQLSRLELLETIRHEIETNPILDEQLPYEVNEEMESGEERSKPDQIIPEVTVKEHMGKDSDWEAYISEFNTGWTDTPYEPKDLSPIENTTSKKTSLYSNLMWQLNMNNFNDVQKEIGIHIIGNINENGYLKTSVEEISHMTGHCLEEVTETLKQIQQFDPVGVAARDTRECILIQALLQDLGGTIVEKIIQDHMGKLENKRYDRIAKSLAIPLEEVLSAVSIIRAFEPKPGRMYNDEETIYISPDIYVFNVGDDYEIVLNENGMPKLRINNYYRNLLSKKDSLSESTKQYIEERLKSAAWLIKSVHQRQRTIYRVTESIVNFQRSFFDKGVAYLKPLVLRDVAESIKMHESTVSRVTTNKYVHTPQGIFELKYFFSSAIDSISGESVSSNSVKEHLKNIIKSENKAKPYNDQEIADILKKCNTNLARRTVTKYREDLGILPARKRREFC